MPLQFKGTVTRPLQAIIVPHVSLGPGENTSDIFYAEGHLALAIPLGERSGSDCLLTLQYNCVFWIDGTTARHLQFEYRVVNL